MKKSFLKELLKRRIPQIIGSYVIASSSLVLFIEYLVEKYNVSEIYPSIVLFGVLAIIPSVIILAYFHGAPGKDEWTRIEKVGIPLNILFMACMLFFGDNFKIWDINKEESPKNYLIHFTSLPEHIPHISKILHLENFETLESVDSNLLDSLRQHFQVQLLNWYFGKEKTFTIPDNSTDINSLNEVPLLSVNLDFTGARIDDLEQWFTNADFIYNLYNYPDHIIYLNIYKTITNNNKSGYKLSASFVSGNPKDGNNGNGDDNYKNLDDLFNNIGEGLKHRAGDKKYIGYVSEIKDDIVFVKLEDINVQKNMEIEASNTYYFGYDHFDYNKGYQDKLEDNKNRIEYVKRTKDEKYILDLDQYIADYTSILSDSLYCIQGCVQTVGNDYTLRVIEIMDSIAITKFVRMNHPWMKLRLYDQVFVAP